MSQNDPLPRPPDFKRTITFLRPVRRNGVLAWPAHMENPFRWAYIGSSPQAVMHALAELLPKALAYQQNGNRGRPPTSHGSSYNVPNVPAGWIVEITADLQEEDTAWAVEIKNASAWANSGSRLSAVLAKLADRMLTDRLDPVEWEDLDANAHPSLPRTELVINDTPLSEAGAGNAHHGAATILEQRQPAQLASATISADQIHSHTVSFERLTEQALAQVEVEISTRERRIIEIDREMDQFIKERRALRNALKAYRAASPQGVTS